MDRFFTSAFVDGAAVPTAGACPVQLLLLGGAGVATKPALHAFVGRGIHASSFLRGAQDDLLAAAVGLWGGTQAGAANAAPDGFDGLLAQAAFEFEPARAPAVSLLVRGCKNREGQSGLEHRHHLYSAARGLCVFGRDSGLVQPLRAGVGVVDQFGVGFLPGGFGTGLGTAAPGDLQHRPGSAVYQRTVSGAAAGGPGELEHGWARAGVRQYLRGAAVAQRE